MKTQNLIIGALVIIVLGLLYKTTQSNQLASNPNPINPPISPGFQPNQPNQPITPTPYSVPRAQSNDPLTQMQVQKNGQTMTMRDVLGIISQKMPQRTRFMEGVTRQCSDNSINPNMKNGYCFVMGEGVECALDSGQTGDQGCALLVLADQCITNQDQQSCLVMESNRRAICQNKPGSTACLAGS
jgi:hypothetical protein